MHPFAFGIPRPNPPGKENEPVLSFREQDARDKLGVFLSRS